MTPELRAEPGEAWARDKGRDQTRAVHPGRHRRAPEARSSYREVFAIGEFRALWSAQVLSFAGDQFAQVAIAILVYGRITALAYALTYLPPIAGGPCCPVWRTSSRAAGDDRLRPVPGRHGR
ncbi:MAG TPA: hypothetical protein VE888_24760 [Streptosporangiaceae bacterium]|nr:hypothetical protein [Streptosporangiaceae bacterium]